MSRERRDTIRQHTYLAAFVYSGAGTPMGKCIVKDVSEHGAKLVYSAAEELPDELVLTMGRARQRCRVMWRHQNEVGVEFDAPK